ncbi:MAG: HD domain-containing protein [Spirochaetaceae bacterium]|nr:MAG: HD domain-containing protein [Spirochaetaceae bacterium]
MNQLLNSAISAGFRFSLQTFSALDRYFGIKNKQMLFLVTGASIPELAGHFDSIEFHGMKGSDIHVHDGRADGTDLFIQTDSSNTETERKSHTVLDLVYDLHKDIFFDPYDVYNDLRQAHLRPVRADRFSWYNVADTAILISRYHYEDPDICCQEDHTGHKLTVFEQRHFLIHLLSCAQPGRGLSYLAKTGFLASHWPELDCLHNIPQTKDYHPEGNVFEHICEAFKSRKTPDIVLSLGILLHDIGKSVATGSRDKPYLWHTDSGAMLARQFLHRLGFMEEVITDVTFLVRHHMMPEAIPGMPLYRIEKLLSSPLFPALLELYRADLLSTFRGPQQYYNACRVYRTFCKTRRNPFRKMQPGKRIVV